MSTLHDETTQPSLAAIAAIPGIPDESESTTGLANDYDEITAAIDRAQMEAARRRDELAAIAQGDQAVMAKALQRMEAEAYLFQQMAMNCLDIAALTAGSPIPDYLYERCKFVAVMLGTRPGDPIRDPIYVHGLTPPVS